MMYEVLYRYFILHKQLNVPGVGTFLLQRKPAVADFPNRQILPPAFAVAFQQEVTSPSKHFFQWLAAALKISDRDAIVRYHDFAFTMKKQLSAGDSIEWNGMGKLSHGLAGEIKFEPAEREPSLLAPIKAEKIIREKAEHTVRVGEEEKTATEMRDFFSHSDEKKDQWWIGALAAGILLFIFTGWYFSTHGLKTSSTGYGQKLRLPQVTASYQPLR